MYLKHCISLYRIEHTTLFSMVMPPHYYHRYRFVLTRMKKHADIRDVLKSYWWLMNSSVAYLTAKTLYHMSPHPCGLGGETKCLLSLLYNIVKCHTFSMHAWTLTFKYHIKFYGKQAPGPIMECTKFYNIDKIKNFQTELIIQLLA